MGSLSHKSIKKQFTCKFSLKHSQERQLLWKLSLATPLRMSKPKFKIRKESHLISNVSFSPESNSKMAEHFLTTTFKKNLHSILSSDFVAAVLVLARLSHPLLLSPESSSVKR